MNRFMFRTGSLIILLPLCLPVISVLASQNLPLEKIRLPAGFKISLYAEGVKSAREMSFSPEGILFVGSFSGNVYALPDQDRNGKADEVITIARGLTMPVGVDFHDGALFVSSVNRILRFDDIVSRLRNPPSPTVVFGEFPSDQRHGWKFIRFGPDGKLYVPVGAPCNACKSDNPVFATITRMNADGSGFEIFASGIRNTVGFDWDPATGNLWFSENGRDLMGDDLPPDEINVAPQRGLHFGFPYIHGREIPDPKYGNTPPKIRMIPPAMELGPHVAALGMRFYRGRMFPEAYRGRIFIAEHGSWNRSDPIGYRITMATVSQGTASGYFTFAEGWLEGDNAWGRPADVEIAPDGSLYVSDDKAGAIYRISYEQP